MADVVDTNTVASSLYTFNDIQEGKSTVVFYGGNWRENNNSSGCILSNSTFYSSDIVCKYYLADAATSVKVMEKDFDLSFGSSRIVNGVVTINVPMSLGDGSAAVNNITCTLSGQIIVYHVDADGVETELDRMRTETVSIAMVDSYQEGKMFHVSTTLSNRRFMKNEKLRITTELWAANNSSAAVVCGIGNDPMNRNDPDTTTTDYKCFPDALDTNMLVQVPFKVEVET